MFGLVFDGHPALTPLLLAGGPDAPLRKERVLAARADLDWPGAVDPADGPGGSPGRRRLPPGAPPPVPPGEPL
jgi:NADH-quinone oxidoreductase subunit C